MLTESKFIAVVVGLGLFACGEGKLLDPGLDYGPEDAPASAKDDSATNPASMARLTIGTVLKTTFTATSRWRAFVFTATAGEKLDIYVDGLRGLDTVAYVYNVSATTGRPYSRNIARNDDTETSGWTVGSNTTGSSNRFNPQSSSILGFVPRYSRGYAVVVTTYQQAGRGTANVVVRRAAVDVPKFVAGGTGRFVELAGIRAEELRVNSAVTALSPSMEDVQDMPASTAAFKASPAALRAQLTAAPGAPAFVGAAFGRAFVGEDDAEFFEYLAGSSSVAAIAPQQAGVVLAELLAAHRQLTDGQWAVVRPRFNAMGASAAAGATHAFSVRMEESGDWSNLAVVLVDVNAGEVRLLKLSRHD